MTRTPRMKLEWMEVAPLTMRIETPPPGKAKPFDQWATAIVARARDYLPDIRAVRKGSRLVVIRHGEREARLSMDGASCWITFTSTTIATTMASLFDDRRDDFTVDNLAHTIAGYFDARFTRA
jgi:hypothetical protein